MTIDATKTIRFMSNNALEFSTTTITSSSEDASFPLENLTNKFRSKLFKFTGRFTIGASNCKIYVDDGAAKTATLTSAEYTTPAALATEVQTQLNAVSSNWTCTYSASTFKFIIGHTGAATLTITSTTNAAWTTLGYTGGVDRTGTSFTAETQMNHYPNEYIKADLGVSTEVGFLGIVTQLSEEFLLSSSATITIEANSIDDWTSPSIQTTLTRTNDGIFHFFHSAASTYRWWRLLINDPQNTIGPGIGIGYIYLGEYQTFSRNIKKGFSIRKVDPSLASSTVSGSLYYDQKTQYRIFSNNTLEFINATNKEILLDEFARNGQREFFFVSFDPYLDISAAINELSAYVKFDGDAECKHEVYDVYSLSFTLKEVI